MAEEVAQRLAGVQNARVPMSSADVPRVVQVLVDPDRMAAHQVSPLERSGPSRPPTCVKQLARCESGPLVRVAAGEPFSSAALRLGELVVGAFHDRPVRLKDVARIEDGPDELSSTCVTASDRGQDSLIMSTSPVRRWQSRNRTDCIRRLRTAPLSPR